VCDGGDGFLLGQPEQGFGAPEQATLIGGGHEALQRVSLCPSQGEWSAAVPHHAAHSTVKEILVTYLINRSEA
jgi:hypothetical protein